MESKKKEVIGESIDASRVEFDKEDILIMVKLMLKSEMERVIYKNWIENLEIETMDDDNIVLIVHSNEQKHVIEERLNILLFHTFEYVTKKERKIRTILK